MTVLQQGSGSVPRPSLSKPATRRSSPIPRVSQFRATVRGLEALGETVHQTEITLQEFHDLLVDFQVREQCELGGALSLTGWHPDVGSVVAVQDGATAFLLTDRPLSFSCIADTYLLETAIARMLEVRTTLEECKAHPERPLKLPIGSLANRGVELSKPLRGMLTWLGIDPLSATTDEITYAKEAVAHVHEMAALPADKLAELHSALVADMKDLVAQVSLTGHPARNL
jgi:hypothetical protein